MSAIFDTQKDGAGQAEIYSDLVNQLGLDNTLQLALLLPKGYEAPERIVQATISAYLGGYDGMLKRLHDAAVNNPNSAEQFAGRLEEYVQKLTSTFSDEERLQAIWGQRYKFGLAFMTDLLKDYIARRQ